MTGRWQARRDMDDATSPAARPRATQTDFVCESPWNRGSDGMHKLEIGDVTITSIIERDGPWRKPADMFPACQEDVAQKHRATLDPENFDAATGKMVIPCQTFVVRTPHHTILVDTCTGED